MANTSRIDDMILTRNEREIVFYMPWKYRAGMLIIFAVAFAVITAALLNRLPGHVSNLGDAFRAAMFLFSGRVAYYLIWPYELRLDYQNRTIDFWKGFSPFRRQRQFTFDDIAEVVVGYSQSGYYKIMLNWRPGVRAPILGMPSQGNFLATESDRVTALEFAHWLASRLGVPIAREVVEPKKSAMDSLRRFFTSEPRAVAVPSRPMGAANDVVPAGISTLTLADPPRAIKTNSEGWGMRAIAWFAILLAVFPVALVSIQDYEHHNSNPALVPGLLAYLVLLGWLPFLPETMIRSEGRFLRDGRAAIAVVDQVSSISSKGFLVNYRFEVDGWERFGRSHYGVTPSDEPYVGKKIVVLYLPDKPNKSKAFAGLQYVALRDR